MAKKRFILASQSPRRRELLTSLRLSFEGQAPAFVEISRPELSPEKEVSALARGKVESLAPQFPGSVILGCDTLVVLEGKKLGKPLDKKDAFKMLQELSGKTHRVLTGLFLWDGDRKKSWELLEETKVKMRNFSEAEAQDYVATGEPMDKAGAYGIQGKGGDLVESIEGDFYNVVGLPLQRLAQLLENVGIKVELSLVPDPRR